MVFITIMIAEVRRTPTLDTTHATVWWTSASGPPFRSVKSRYALLEEGRAHASDDRQRAIAAPYATKNWMRTAKYFMFG